MKYKLEFSPEGVAKIGAALDKEPHGEVAALYADIQKQLTAQDDAFKEEVKASQLATVEKWKAEERAKIEADLKKKTKRKRRRKPAEKSGES